MALKKKKIDGEVYKIIVAKVIERDVHGRPSKADLLYDDQVTDVAQGDEFLTIFVPAFATKKQAPN